MSISVVVLCRNDEDMIKGCLESVKWADELLVVDNESTDRTVAIAKKYTTKVVEFKGINFEQQRNSAMAQTSGDWVLYVDSDERVLEPLKREILKLVQDDVPSVQDDVPSVQDDVPSVQDDVPSVQDDVPSVQDDVNRSFAGAQDDRGDIQDDRGDARGDKEAVQDDRHDGGSCSAYALSRINIIFGQKVDYGPYRKDWMIRLFKRRDFKTWVGQIHEHATFNGKLGYSQHSLLHLTHRGVDHIVLKNLHWSPVYAKLLVEAKHPKMVGWRFMRIFLTELWFQGVVRRGFFSGTVGIMDSMMQVFSQYMTYVRLWEMQQPKPIDQIYQQIDQKLIESEFKSY